MSRPVTAAASRTQHAYDVLRQELLDCKFEPGQPLRIQDLCKRLDVSQGAVREALSRLTSEGLVESEPQRGFRVTAVSAADLKDLTTTRIQIEQLCLRQAIALGDIQWEARILAAFHELSRTPAIEAEAAKTRRFSARFVALHHSFFDTLVSGCKSFWLARLRQNLQLQEFRYHGHSPPPSPGERDLIAELRDLMQATIDRKADRACALLSAHMSRSAEALIAHMEKRARP
jgi:DNA-binding GntR family transcriptional regulator